MLDFDLHAEALLAGCLSTILQNRARHAAHKSRRHWRAGIRTSDFFLRRCTMAQLHPGDPAPAFTAPDQNGGTVKSSDYSGSKLFVYFYPKANTSG
jgi:peroxiredoxin Q/BCP